MNKDELIRMAREAGIERDDDFAFDESDSGVIYYIHPGTLERFYALAVAAEREACAKVCERMPDLEDGWRANTPSDCAEAIRARGNT